MTRIRADHRWRRWLAIVAGSSALVAGCGGSSRPKTGESTKDNLQLPDKGCGLLSDAVVTALLGGPPIASHESGLPGGSPQGSVVGCTWMGAGGRQAGVTLHQGPNSARDFADNTNGPASQPISGLGDKAMLHVVAGQEEGTIEVLEGDADILVFGTLSGSTDGYAATIEQAAAMILTHVAPR